MIVPPARCLACREYACRRRCFWITCGGDGVGQCRHDRKGRSPPTDRCAAPEAMGTGTAIARGSAKSEGRRRRPAALGGGAEGYPQKPGADTARGNDPARALPTPAPTVTYRIEYPKDVAKRLDRLDRPTCQRIETRMNAIEANPYDPRISKPLREMEGIRSSRVGGWRICYTVNRSTGVIYVLSVERRGQVYKRL